MEGRTSCWKTASVSLADHSRCPGQLSQRVRIQRIPRLPQEADPMLQVLPPTAQRFANDKCPVGAPPLGPRLSRWNLVNPPPTHPEKGGFCGVPEQWGPGPHTVEETPSAPALSPDLADDVSPHRGRAALSPAPPPERSSSSKDTGAGGDLQMPRSSSATVALPAGCGLLLASTA